MATILGGITTSHIPAIGNAIQRGRENDPYWKPFFDGYIPVRAWLDHVSSDARWLFLSSANLTEYAFTINMELGVLVTGGKMPAQVQEHFDRLVAGEWLAKVEGLRAVQP